MKFLHTTPLSGGIVWMEIIKFISIHLRENVSLIAFPEAEQWQNERKRNGSETRKAMKNF